MSNHSLFLKSGFPRAAYNNGIGRYVTQLQRVTLKFCKNRGSSRGMRDFLENDLVNFAQENPGVVVYVKPRRHRAPIIKAEYLNGAHQWINVSNYLREDIVKWIELVRTQDDDGSALRFRKMWHTDFPSIQGPWNPLMFKHPTLNLVQFPNEEIGAPAKVEKSATEKLLEIYKAQKEEEEKVKESKDKSQQAAAY